MKLDFNIEKPKSEQPKAKKKKLSKEIEINEMISSRCFVPKNSTIVSGLPLDNYDLAPVKKLVESYSGEFEVLQQQVDALQVVDESTAETATEMYAQLKDLWTKIEDKRKEDTKDRRSWVRSYDAIVKTVRDKIEFLEHTIKQDKLNPYHYQVELKRRAEEKKQREAIEAAQKKLDDDAKKNGVETVTLPEMKIPKKAAPIRTAVGTASSRMKWVYEIEDETKLERQYLMPDLKAIKQAVDGGIRKINGVRIYETADTQIRKT